MFHFKENQLIFKSMLLFMAFAMLFIAGCDEDSPTSPETQEGFGKELMIDASSKTDWVYFSFSAGEVVTVADPANSTEWDLGLMRYHLKTNSGTSGKGQSGVDRKSVV